VTLTTDIVLDVVRAADPIEASAAKQRLAAMAGGESAGTSFASALGAGAVGRAGSDNSAEAFEKFEAFVLQTFLEAMLPDDAGSVYGDGFAGDMWKSMMAEQLAAQMARAGGIGIADRVLGDYYMRGEDKVALSGVPSTDEREQSQARSLASQALVHEIQRRVGGSLAEGGAVTDRKSG
jgi:peptidoglycan hydrolase FlgJ